MKILRNIVFLLLISFLGEVCNYYIALPIPGSIYGIVILLILLIINKKIYKNVSKTFKELINFFPILFISPAVGLIDIISEVKNVAIEIILIIIISTIFSLAISAKVAQILIERNEK